MRRMRAWVGMLVCLLVLVGVVPVAADFGPLANPQIPSSHTLPNFPLVGQSWNLTCEYAATSAATAFYGNMISQGDFVNTIGFDANPNKGFRGSLSGPWGGTWDYGIYARPILNILLQRGFTHSYMIHADTMLLREAISNDHPVVIWIDDTYGGAPRYQEEQNGEQFLLVPFEHAVTMIGYTEEGVTIMDPAYPSIYTVPWDSFLRAWLPLDGMALAVVV